MKRKYTIKRIKSYLKRLGRTNNRNRKRKLFWNRKLTILKKRIKTRLEKEKRIKAKLKRKKIKKKEFKYSKTKRNKLLKSLKGKEKILAGFKRRTISEEKTDLSKIRHNPKKGLNKVLDKALKPKKRIMKRRIARQEQKYKHLMEYDIQIWGESNGQIVLITQFTDKNKTIKKLKQQLEELGIQEGNVMEDTKLYTYINPNLKINAEWLPTTKTAVITKVKVNIKLIKG